MSDAPKRAQRRRRPKGLSYEVLRDRVAIIVAAGATARAAAEKVGVSEDTVHDWLREPAVAARVTALRADALGEARKALLAAGPAAVAKLVELAEAGDRQAAIAVLDRIGLHPKQTVVHEGEDLTEATVDELRAKAAAIVERLSAANGGRLDA